MRPVSSRVATLWITVLCLLASFNLTSLASAQPPQKHKAIKAQKAPNGLPPVTTDTWKGGASGDWSTAANWTNGAIGTGFNIVIASPTNAATTDDQSYTIGTLTLSNSGNSVALNNNIQTTVEGNISNAGTISFNAAGNDTGFFLNNSLTLSGSGSIDLTSTNGQYTGYLYGTAGAVLTTSSNIVGAGTVGNGELNFVNSGTMNANISGQNLLVNPDTCTGCTNTNTGTLEATNGGVLTLSGGAWTNSGGTIKASGTGSAVNLQSNVSITSGTLTTSSGGVINDVGGNNVFLTNVTNSGNYFVQNNAATEINGTLTNTGTITLNAAGNATQLYLAGNTTLSGAGTVVLTSSNEQWSGQITGVSGSNFVLTNQSTIEGWGSVGLGTIQIANASNGVINSNVSGGNIQLSPTTNTTSTNAGLMEGTNGGTLTMAAGTWSNTGTIEAAAGSSVVLTGNVSITGGTIESVGTGTVIDQGGNNVFLTGLTLAGTYNIQNNAATEISGTIVNNGTIDIQASGNTTGLYVNPVGSNSATLKGTGTIVLDSTNGQYTGYIYGTAGGNLTIDQQVTGAGTIGNGDLTLTNNSTINANLSPTVTTAALTISPGAGMTNNGTLEATNGGTLVLTDGSTFTNATGGVIEAVGSDSKSNPSTVVLTGNVTVSGGTLTTSGAGAIVVASGNTANLTSLTNNGTLNVQNAGEILSTGTITNNGTITLQGTGNQTYFYSPNATTLTGTGTLVMGTTNNQYTAYVDMPGGLTNDETITGAGTLGNGTFVNNGTVNANISGQNLVMQSFTAATNTKTLEATNGGTLIFNGSAWTNTGGTITAQTGSAVQLTSNTTITGGTLTSVGTGQVYILNGNQANLTNLTNSGALNVQNSSELISTGTITNNGTITLQGAGNQTYFYAPNATTLTGSGTLVMSSTNGQYTGNVDAAGGLINDETITGAGTIDSGSFTNNGTVNANVSGQAVTLQSLATLVNTKTMEASNGGTLILSATPLTNTGGTIEAEAGSSVELTGGTTITGGTLTSAGTGQVFVSGEVVSLVSLTNSGTLNVQNNGQLQFTGTMTNSGTLNIQGAGNTTYLLINGSVTLNGTGTIDLTSTNGQYTNAIYGEGTAPILISHNTIEGAGNLGSSNMGFTNDGTVDANIAGQTLAINVNSTGFTNYNASTTTLTGGTYIANGGTLTFAAGNSTGITTLAASVTEEAGGQFINATSGNNALASLTSITSTGALTTDVNFTDAGSFSNAGSLTILAGTSFKVASLSQISGSSLTAGTYVLDANLSLTGATETITTNAATLTLAGGTIENANSTNALAGLATNSGKLTIGGTSNKISTTAATFSNTGTLTINKGDSFTAKKLTQISGTTLSAGTYVLGGNLDLSTTGISVTTNSATLTLEGGTIDSGTANALGALAANTKSLTIAGTATKVTSTATSFSNTGTLTINTGDSFTVGNLTQISSGSLTAGTYVLTGNLDLTTAGISITSNAANLTLEGGTINSNNVNALSALASNSGTLTLAGTEKLTTSTTSAFTNTGTVNVEKGTTLTVGGTNNTYSQTAGTTTVDGTLAGVTGTGLANITGGTIQGAGTVTGNVSVGNATGGAVATINVGDSGKAGLLAITGTYTQLATGNMTGLVSGTAAGTGYSQLKVTGAASLAGTINFTVASSFQSSLKAGQTFTVLTASSITGTFSNTTIAINSSFHFNVSYTSTGVVLTVATGATPASSGSLAQPVAMFPVASTKPVSTLSKSTAPASGLRHPVSGIARISKPILVAGTPVRVGGSELSSLRSWEHIPAITMGQNRPTVVNNAIATRLATPIAEPRVGRNNIVGVRAPLSGWSATNRLAPVKTLPRMLPHVTR